MILPMDTLKTIIAQQPYPLLFATVSGAHLYGFPSPDSDYDLRGVHILPLREMLGLYPIQDTIEFSGDVDSIELDLVTHDVSKFFELLLKRNGYVLEQVLSPHIIHTTAHHEELKSLTQGCITKNHAHHYLGFARTQWGLFLKENPRRTKPLLYVYRVLLTAIHLMQIGELEANLIILNDHYKLPYIPDLIAKKVSGTEHGVLGDADVEFHQREYDRLVQLVETYRDKSHLPESPANKPALNDLLLRIRGVLSA
ncbi:MAG: nucleotidyltransferase domain-containing protein [Phototrophicales bacterium]|nr:nucleotidyltransferase domain-containing protein [Phototrophicales bacterium]